MQHIVVLILLTIAAVMFLLAALGTATRVNLIAVGLFCWVLAVIVPLAQQ
jgi:hypothetical protein